MVKENMTLDNPSQSEQVSRGTVIQVQGLSTQLRTDSGWVHALDDLAFTIQAGKTFALVGESGCGKSITALSIARLLPDNAVVVAGQVHLQAEHTKQDLLQLPENLMRAVRGRRVGVIFQEPGACLNSVMTVGEQVLEVIDLHRPRPRVEALQLAEYLLEQVGLGPERLQQYPFQLSGGQKQRVMIAIALAGQPDLLIADEPTTALDVLVQAQILTLLKTLQQRHGMAILLITHDLGVVAQVADHIALMYAGQVVESASTTDFFAHPRHPYAAALLAALPDKMRRHQRLRALPGHVPSLIDLLKACRFADRCDRVQGICQQTAPNLQPCASNHMVRCFFPLAVDEKNMAAPFDFNKSNQPIESSESSEPNKVEHLFEREVFLQVRDLKVAYRQSTSWVKPQFKPVVHGINFSIQQGKTLAIVGESGSGKSTVAKALLRLLDASAKLSGEVILNGQPVLQASAAQLRRIRQIMQVVFQDPFSSLNPRQRIVDILLEGIEQLCPDVSKQTALERAQQALQEVSLPVTALGRFAHEFSGGQRQRLAIARALVVQPKILILDEPTSALDVSVQAQVLNLLQSLQHRYGITYLLITHNLAVVQYMADHILVMKQGRAVEAGNTEEVLQRPESDYTRELLASLLTV